MTDQRPVVLVVDRSGYQRYLDGPAGVLFPPDRFAVQLLSIGPTTPERATPLVVAQLAVATDSLVPAAANELADRYGRPDAVVTATERDLMLAARLRERFDAPGLTVAQTERFRDKVVMKQHLAAAGIRVPRFAAFDQAAARALLADGHELIVKPRGGAGSEGVRHLRTVAELDRLPGTVSADGFEVEEFITGSLHHVDSVVHQGRTIAATAGSYLDPTTGFATSLSYLRSVSLPAGPERDALLAFNAAVLACHPYLSGVTHLEVFRRPDGELVFCEIAARVGGGAVAASFHARTGVDLHAVHLQAQVGLAPPLDIAVSPLMTGSLLFYAGPGWMARPPQLPEQPWLIGADVYLPEDRWLDAPADGGQAVVSAGVTGGDPATVRDRLRQTIDAITATLMLEPGDRPTSGSAGR